MTIIIILLSATMSPHAYEGDDITDYIKNGIKGTVVELGKHYEIVVKLETGDHISFVIIFDEWAIVGDDVLIFYSVQNGISIKNIRTEYNKVIRNYITPHLIDIAANRCGKKNPATPGYEACATMENEFWESELNRAYQAIGGSNNQKLKIAQLAWLKFRDAQLEYYKSLYFSRPGSMWGLIYINAKTDLTRKQATRLRTLSYAKPE